MEIFDPATGMFEAIGGDIREPRQPIVSATSPEHGATAVPMDLRVTIRFSGPADVRSLTGSSIVLEGPDGVVLTSIVPVEAGRLVFVTPVEPLRASNDYQLQVQGAAATDGAQIPGAVITFRTADDPSTDHPERRILTRSGRLIHPAGSGPAIDAGASPWQSPPPLQAPSGVTALAGQVLRLDGSPRGCDVAD
jgi:hypothetical protein